MGHSWFIFADDLTGAADSAIAFARRRVPARVIWGDSLPQAHPDAVVLAYDAATRELDAVEAARRHREVLQRFMHSPARLFKKVDSTLRGSPAEEIAAMLDVVLAHEPATCVVMAPSFPAMGRTVRDAQVRVHGVPLPFTEYGRDSCDPAFANVIYLLESAGLRARAVDLATVRAEFEVLESALAETGIVVVCDAETDDDLERIAKASLSAERPGFFIGSAGFAHALAHCVSRAGVPRSSSHRCEPSTRGALVVVGSRSQESRAALAQVTTLANVERISIEPSLLGGDLQSPVHVALADRIRISLQSGNDVVADIAPSAPAHVAGNPRLVSALASLLGLPAREASALVATGGETASALLVRLGVNGIRLLDEIEPGIPLGLTLGGVSVPAVTKAGGFGNEGCLKRIIERLRFIRQTGTVA
jgi:4-hydroxythreonine-4-phosphate dehydrogenase